MNGFPINSNGFAFDHPFDFPDLLGEKVNRILTHHPGHGEILILGAYPAAKD